MAKWLPSASDLFRRNPPGARPFSVLQIYNAVGRQEDSVIEAVP